MTKMANTPSTMLITGAAKRVGAYLAEYFATRGWNMVLHYHHSQREVEILAEKLRAAYQVDVTLKQADLGNPNQLSAFWQDLPVCRAIIHNAAMFERDTLASMQSAMLQQQLQVNFIAPLLLSQGFMAQLPADGHGSITLLGDGVMGWSMSPEFFSYAISKSALQGSVDLLASACAPRVRVNMVALAPTLKGPTDTDAMFARLAARAPLQRTGSPEEVAQAVAYCVQALGVTGQVISLAGGAQLASYRDHA
jgi:NAD(P)-dependent dehydrogenase (short-subunit alcohol dehydrogenase family)